MDSKERWRKSKGYTLAASLKINLEDHKRYIKGTVKPKKVNETEFFEEKHINIMSFWEK